MDGKKLQLINFHHQHVKQYQNLLVKIQCSCFKSSKKGSTIYTCIECENIENDISQDDNYENSDK